MDINYKVHSATSSPIAIETTHNGSPITANVDGFIVELLSEDGSMTHTLKAITSEDIQELSSKFHTGQTITATFSFKE